MEEKGSIRESSAERKSMMLRRQSLTSLLYRRSVRVENHCRWRVLIPPWNWCEEVRAFSVSKIWTLE